MMQVVELDMEAVYKGKDNGLPLKFIKRFISYQG